MANDAHVISRDIVRESLYGKRYSYKEVDENKVNSVYNEHLQANIEHKNNLVVDNCHLRMKYITDTVNSIPEDYSVEFKLFPITYRKAYWRNIWRWMRTGKWIPPSYLKKCVNNYEKLIQNGQYLFHIRYPLPPQEYSEGGKHMEGNGTGEQSSKDS